MKKNLFLIFLLNLTSFCTYAESWKAPASDQLGLKIGFSTPSLSLEFLPDPDLSSSQGPKYQPHSPSNTFMALAYRNLGISLSKTNPQKEDEVLKKGTTSSTDFQLRFFGKRITHEYIYQKYNGYYIENSSDIDSNYANSQNKIIRDDVATEHIGIQFIYSFQDDSFSMPAAFDQFYRQTSSGGSWLGFLYFDQYNFLADSPFIPTALNAAFPNLANVDSAHITSFGVGGGYGGSLVFGNFYLSGLLALGFGPRNLQLDQGDRTHIAPAARSACA